MTSIYQKYSFANPPHLTHTQREKMHAFFSTFCHSIQKRLSTQWEEEVKFEIKSIEEVSASRKINALPRSSPSMEFYHIGTDYPGFFLLSSHSLRQILSQMDGSPLGNRTLNNFEQALTRKFFSFFLETLSECLKDSPQLRLKTISSSRTLKKKWKDQICSSVTFEITWGKTSCQMELLFSFLLGDMITSLLEEPTPKETHTPNLNDIKIPLNALLGKFSLSKKDLAQLETGDIILLDTKTDTPINVETHGKRAFVGNIGSKGTRKGVKIEWISPEGDNTL